MKELPIKLGPLALLLTVISICMTTLAILTFTTARADMSLADTHASTVAERYELETEGQEVMAKIRKSGLSAAGQEYKAEPVGDGTYVINIMRDNGFSLKIRFDGEYNILEWSSNREWQENTDIGNLWPGR